MIFQSFTSTITKSNPFFATVRIFSISVLDKTLNFLPIFFPFGFTDPSFSITTYFAADDVDKLISECDNFVLMQGTATTLQGVWERNSKVY